MRYFFLERQRLAGGLEVELDEQDLTHAFRVLRLKPGDSVAVADALGTVFSGRITVSEPKKVRVCLHDELSSAESPLNIALYHSLSKGEKMDLVIRQAVELGVRRIVPVVTTRSIPELDSSKEKKKNQRWQNIARSAAAQCRRAYLPRVERVRSLNTILPEFGRHRTLVPWEEESGGSLEGFLKQPCPEDKAVSLFIGPEGGFDAGEIRAARDAGAQIVHLGPRILRTETAATAALAMIQAAWGDLGQEREKQ